MIERLDHYMEQASGRPPAADFPDRLIAPVHTEFFEFIGEHRRSWALLRQEAAVAVPSAQEEVEGIRQQQTDMIGAVLASFTPDIDPLEAEAFAEIVVGATERLAVWTERRPEVGPALATEYVMAVIWPGVANRLLPPT